MNSFHPHWGTGKVSNLPKLTHSWSEAQILIWVFWHQSPCSLPFWDRIPGGVPPPGSELKLPRDLLNCLRPRKRTSHHLAVLLFTLLSTPLPPAMPPATGKQFELLSCARYCEYKDEKRHYNPALGNDTGDRHLSKQDNKIPNSL